MNKLSTILFNSLKDEIDQKIKHIFEGGAWGHLSHPFEDENLTFQDLKDIITDSLSGKLVAFEKTDGQQLSFSWKNGRLVCARNKGHLKNKGANALNKEQLKTMFSDRPENVRDAFSKAVDDLDSALSKIDENILNKIFQEGSRFMSVEVILPSTKNVIPYGLNLLVFHGTLEYDAEGIPIGVGMENSGKFLSDIIKSINADIQKTFVLRGPNRIVFNKMKDFKIKKQQYIDELNSIKQNLKFSDKVVKLYIQKWTHLIIEIAGRFDYDIEDELLKDLIDRWALQNKTKTISKIIKSTSNEKFAEWIKNFDKTDSFITHKKFVEPIEILFLKLGADILSNASGFLSTNHTEAAQKIAQEVKQASEEIKNSKDPKDIKKLEFELERISKIGGTEKLSGTEGVTFYKNGNIYKLTGLFAPIGQILGIIKYKK